MAVRYNVKLISGGPPAALITLGTTAGAWADIDPIYFDLWQGDFAAVDPTADLYFYLYINVPKGITYSLRLQDIDNTVTISTAGPLGPYVNVQYGFVKLSVASLPAGKSTFAVQYKSDGTINFGSYFLEASIG